MKSFTSHHFSLKTVTLLAALSLHAVASACTAENVKTIDDSDDRSTEQTGNSEEGVGNSADNETVSDNNNGLTEEEIEIWETISGEDWEDVWGENSTDEPEYIPLSDAIDFDVSNIEDKTLEVLNEPGEFRFEGEDCADDAWINTDDCTALCADTEGVHCDIMTLSDHSEVAVVYANDFYVATNVQLRIWGQRPLILVAREDITVLGSIEAYEDIRPNDGILGGFSGTETDDPSDGNGPGAGEGLPGLVGAGGGGYCGRGGEGGSDADGNLGGEGGAVYGNPEIVPLRGGSSGGTREDGDEAGAGGGAIQLVAGNKIYIGEVGAISMPGNGTGWYHGNGAGSGGAILLEAPNVIIKGILAANGGSGGGGTYAGNGLVGNASNEPAAGGADDDTPRGGDGSAGDTAIGANGENLSVDAPLSESAGGGGGGAGWIRINTEAGDASLDGILSPSLESDCASVGTLNE